MKYVPLIIGAVIAFTACGKNEPQTPAPANTGPQSAALQLSADELKSMGVTFSEASETQAKKTIVIPAGVIVDQERTGAAISLVDGRIRDVYAKLGARVTKGAILATIESMQTGTLFAEALRSQAEMETAQKEYERLKALHTEKVTSDKTLQRAQSDYVSAKAAFDGAMKQLAASGMSPGEISALLQNPDKVDPVLAVRAPITGTVSVRNASQGSKVQSTDELFVIVNNSSVTVEGNAYQDDLSILKPGMSVEFTTSAYPGQVFPGKLEVVSAILDAEAHTLPVRCTIPNSNGALKPNLNGELAIYSGAVKTILSVPSQSIVYDGNDTYVFRQHPEGGVDYTPVQTGAFYGDRIEITGGLAPGDKIVSGGVFMLKSKYKLSQSAEE